MGHLSGVGAVEGRHVGCSCGAYAAALSVHSVSLTLRCSKADFAPSSSRLSHPIFEFSNVLNF